MINFNRVFAMVYRYAIYLKHNWDRLSDMFYWPALDLFIWGLTGLYLATLNANHKEYIFIILNGLIFWIIIWRVQYEINVNILSEIWDKNLINILASPLTAWEWVTSLVFVGFIKMIISLTFSATLSLIFYHYNILIYGFYLFPIIVSLLLFGWASGFLVAGFIIRFGAKIQTLAWTGVALFAPFAALYYPLSILPDWAKKVALFVPPSYIFEGMRTMLFKGYFPIDKLVIGFALNIPYLLLSLWFFVFMFNKSKKLGLGRLI
ncbi:MAG: ABC transporter permease [Candidatus Levybacteria bacterium]|nr:ABC transporter permease [Candidatus Levybacteria bacterium]